MPFQGYMNGDIHFVLHFGITMEKTLELSLLALLCLCLAAAHCQKLEPFVESNVAHGKGANCTFNYGTCGYYQASTKKTGWLRKYGTEMAGTKGWYLMFNESKYERGHVAEVQAPFNGTPSYYCIRFFYASWQTSSGIKNALTLGYDTSYRRSLYKTLDHTYGGWEKAVIYTYLSSSVKDVFFSVKKESNSTVGYFAIDDVVIYPSRYGGACT